MKRILIIITLLSIVPFLQADGWQPVAPTGDVPSPRYGHTMVNIEGKFYLFGGQGNEARALFLDSTYMFNHSTNNWKNLKPTSKPTARQGHSAVAYNGKMYMFGGQGQQDYQDVWVYDPVANSWQMLGSSGGPASRVNHAAAVLGGSFYISGGKKGDGSQLYGDLWSYNIASQSWIQKASFPQGGRYGHSMAAIGNKLYVYGGETANGISADIWVYDASKNSWNMLIPQHVAPGRRNQVTVADSSHIWVCGGYGGSERAQELGEIWEYDVANNDWLQKSTGPVQMRGAGVLVQPSRQSEVDIFLFGGQKAGQAINDSWKYSSNQASSTSIKGEIGALGKGRYAMFKLNFAQDQTNVRAQFSWTEKYAKFKLVGMHLSLFAKNRPAFLRKMENDPGRFTKSCLKYFHEVPTKTIFHKGSYSITKTFPTVKAGTFMMALCNHREAVTARSIQLELSGMQNLPSQLIYLFPVGDPDRQSRERTSYLNFPLIPSRWYSSYPTGTDGQETTETGQGFWQWRWIDRTRTALFPPATLTFDLP